MIYVLEATRAAAVVMLGIVLLVLAVRGLLRLVGTPSWRAPRHDPPLRLEKAGAVRERLHSEKQPPVPWPVRESGEAEPPEPAA